MIVARKFSKRIVAKRLFVETRFRGTINRAKSRNIVAHQHCNLLHSTDYLRYLFADSSLFNRTTVFDNPSWLCSPDLQNSRVTSGDWPIPQPAERIKEIDRQSLYRRDAKFFRRKNRRVFSHTFVHFPWSVSFTVYY